MKRLIAVLLAVFTMLSMTFMSSCGSDTRSKNDSAADETEETNAEVLANAPIDWDTFIAGAKPLLLPKKASREETEALTDSFSGGSGTENDPYLLSSYEDLARLSEICTRYYSGRNQYLGAYYKLTADITMPGKEEPWLPINHFEGVFDGDDHTISNMFAYFSERTAESRESNSDNLDVGFFGNIIRGGTVKNLTVTDSAVISLSGIAASAGAVVGNCSGYVINCHATDSVTVVSDYNGGGVAGEIFFSAYVNSLSETQTFAELRNCTNAATVMGLSYVCTIGGVAGYTRCPISNCENSGDVFSAYRPSKAGGIAGVISDSIYDCKNTGSVTAGSAGGICRSFNAAGLNDVDAKPNAEISGCVNEGRVYAFDGDAAGIGANMTTGAMRNCRNSGEIILAESVGYANLGGLAGTLIESPLGVNSEVFEIINCENTGFVHTEADISDVGGICGEVTGNALSVNISDCRNSGDIICPKASYAGGVVGSFPIGESGLHLTIIRCENTGAVTGEQYVGGMIGKCSSSIYSENVSATLDDCLNSGSLTGTGQCPCVGGMCGYLFNTEKCPFTLEINGCVNSGMLNGPEDAKGYMNDEVGRIFTGKEDD